VTPTPAKPNILLIMADELVAALTGAYGHPVVQTPNLNALVASGARFESAYSPAPLCAPARACLVSGQYTSTNRVYDNAAYFAGDIPCIGHYLTNAGYDCVLSGKMHFVGADQLHGFRRRLTTDIYAEEFNMLDNRAPWSVARDASLFREEDGRGRHGQNYVGSNVHIGRWHHHLAYDEEAHFRAKEYIRARGAVQTLATQQSAAGTAAPLGAEERSAERRHAAAGDPQPFFLTVSYHHPHEPFWAPQDVWDLYEGAQIDVPEYPDNMDETYSAMDRWLNANHGIRFFKEELRSKESLYRVRRAYYALVTYIDRKVGELIDTLKERGLWENTLVIFTSDHGDMLCEKSMVQKRIFYEWSCRVPFIMRFPDERYAGSVVSEPISLVDLLPTLCDVASVPKADLLPHDGKSVIPLLDGSDTAPRTVFAEMHVEDNPTLCFMVRRGRHKYIYLHEIGAQLFDLDADPGEWHNLAGSPEHAQIEDELRRAIVERFDLDSIEADIKRSIEARHLIRQAMRINRTLWDYTPAFDSSRDAMLQYLPPGQ
jgi:choline-sulfatase